MRIPHALILAGILCLNTACVTTTLSDLRDVKVQRAVLTDTQLVLDLEGKGQSNTEDQYQHLWATLEVSDILQDREPQYTLYTSDPLASQNDKGKDVLVVVASQPYQPVARNDSYLEQIGDELIGELLLRREDSSAKVLHYVDLPLRDPPKDRTGGNKLGTAAKELGKGAIAVVGAVVVVAAAVTAAGVMAMAMLLFGGR